MVVNWLKQHNERLLSGHKTPTEPLEVVSWKEQNVIVGVGFFGVFFPKLIWEPEGYLNSMIVSELNHSMLIYEQQHRFMGE